MNRGIAFALLAALFWGVTPVFEKTGLQKVDPLLGTTVRSISITTVLLFIMIFAGKAKQIITIDKGSLLYLAIGGIMAGLLGVWAYFNALKCCPSTLIVPIAATYPLIAMAMSILFLGESFTLSKGIGTLLVVLGIAFLQY